MCEPALCGAGWKGEIECDQCLDTACIICHHSHRSTKSRISNVVSFYNVLAFCGLRSLTAGCTARRRRAVTAYSGATTRSGSVLIPWRRECASVYRCRCGRALRTCTLDVLMNWWLPRHSISSHETCCCYERSWHSRHFCADAMLNATSGV